MSNVRKVTLHHTSKKVVNVSSFLSKCLKGLDIKDKRLKTCLSISMLKRILKCVIYVSKSEEEYQTYQFQYIGY